MKKIILGSIVLLVLFTESCKKNKGNNGGTWAFKGTTYNIMGCDAFPGDPLYSGSQLSAGTSTASDNSLTIQFASWQLPVINEKDTIVNGYPAGKY